jgi:hypothetical protein
MSASFTLSNNFYPVGAHTKDTAVNTVKTLTPPSGANCLLLQTTTKDVRYTLDGSVPDATTGFLLSAGEPILLMVNPGETVKVPKVIEVAASAVLQYQWGKSLPALDMR